MTTPWNTPSRPTATPMTGRTVPSTGCSAREIPSTKNYLLINGVDKLLINGTDKLLISQVFGTEYTSRTTP